MPAVKDLTGRVFNRLTVIAKHGLVGVSGGCRLWLCRCECGQETVAGRSNLESGNTTSCGCARVDATRKNQRTHGQTGTFEYGIWKGIHDRCRRLGHSSFKNYGARGIRVCKRWRKFENFIADMGKAPSDKHSIDRDDPNGPYSPDNCKWLLRSKQNRNRRDTIRITFRGETRALVEWAEHLGLSFHALKRRHYLGWPVELMLTTPIVPYQKVHKR